MNAIIQLLGRLALTAIFALSALGKLSDFPGTVEKMKSVSVPAPEVLLPISIAALVLGSLSLALGLRARLGALALIGFLMAATWFFHNPSDPEQMIAFLKNLALMGGLLMVVSSGSGSLSLDRLLFKKKKK
ncbi:MAG: DoxX family protein [Verrucomicrobiota bacterium]